MRGYRIRKIGGILGLFAILLTFCAPLISQTLRAQVPVDFTFGAFCAADGSVPAHDSDPLPEHDQACAYCSFSHDFPALPGSGIAPLAIAEWTSFAPVIPAPAARPFEAPRHAPPRGPPFIV